MEFPTHQNDPRLREFLQFTTPTLHHLKIYPMLQPSNQSRYPWPNIELAFTNLFEARADWPIPPTPASTVKAEHAEVPPQVAAIPCAVVLPKQIGEKCTLGPHCPICKKEEEDNTEDWNSNRQRDQPKNHHSQNTKHPQSFNVPDQYSEQIRLRREWDEKMESLNKKYGLDYSSSSESNSDFKPEHKYETLI